MEFKEKGKQRRGMSLIVGERRAPSTPSPAWTLHFSSSHSHNTHYTNLNTRLSARKLGANLWDTHPLLTMTSNSHNVLSLQRNKPFEPPSTLVEHPTPQPSSASSSRRRSVESWIEHRRSLDANGHARKLVSSPSCSTSMEVAPCKLVRAPTSSLEYKGMAKQSSYGFDTSAELLKLLDRIWSLEEKRSCNMSTMKSLKMEPFHCQSQIEELLKEKETFRQKIKEKDRVVLSARKELDDERNLRRFAEFLHRKIARELSEVKCTFSDALKELERERKARILLENLCDEFAKGIRDYEREVRSLRNKAEIDHVAGRKPDRLVLHISEAWLDERMEMGLAETPKDTIVDKLSPDIETFLEARHSSGLSKEDWFANEASSAPRDAADEEDSATESDPVMRVSVTGSKVHGLNRALENFVRTGSVSSEGNRIHPDDRAIETCHMSSAKGNVKEESCARSVNAGLDSSVQKWISKLASPEFNKSECYPQDRTKENTLKAKLLEAKLEGYKFRSKASKSFLQKKSSK